MLLGTGGSPTRYLKVAGKWTYLYRAVDQYGQVIDALLSARRDLEAARQFFAQALRSGTVPVEVTTDVPLSIQGCPTNQSPQHCTSWSSTRTTLSRLEPRNPRIKSRLFRVRLMTGNAWRCRFVRDSANSGAA